MKHHYLTGDHVYSQRRLNRWPLTLGNDSHTGVVHDLVDCTFVRDLPTSLMGQNEGGKYDIKR